MHLHCPPLHPSIGSRSQGPGPSELGPCPGAWPLAAVQMCITSPPHATFSPLLLTRAYEAVQVDPGNRTLIKNGWFLCWFVVKTENNNELLYFPSLTHTFFLLSAFCHSHLCTLTYSCTHHAAVKGRASRQSNTVHKFVCGLDCWEAD